MSYNMSLISENPIRHNCPESRDGSRYWTAESNCHLKLNEWEVSFVDTNNGFDKWMNKYGSSVFMFDCEWSQWDKGIGLIQFATLPSTHQVLVVDCTGQVDLAKIKNVFVNNRMVGWAIVNDIKHLGLTETNHLIDLQAVPSHKNREESPFTLLNNADKSRIEAYQPMDRHGNPHPNQWSLDDMAQCLLGHDVKVPIGKHPNWSSKNWKLKDNDIHYAANDVIGVAYLYKHLEYIYEATIPLTF